MLKIFVFERYKTLFSLNTLTTTNVANKQQIIAMDTDTHKVSLEGHESVQAKR